MDPFHGEHKRGGVQEGVGIIPEARIGVGDPLDIIPEHPQDALATDHVVHDEVQGTGLQQRLEGITKLGLVA
jgi:hypothetical protein